MKQSPQYLKAIHNQEIHLINLTSIMTIDQLKLAIDEAFHSNRLQQGQCSMRVATFQGWKDVQHDDDILMLKDRDSLSKVKLYIVEKQQKVKQAQIHNQDKTEESQDVGVQEPRENNKSISMESIIHKAQQHELQQFQYAAEQVQPSELRNKVVELQLPLYTCSSCEDKHTAGTFYRCSVCPDIELCPDCESFCEHDHPLIKIKNPAFAKVKIFAILNNIIEEHKKQEINNVQQNKELNGKQQHVNDELAKQNPEQNNNPSGLLNKIAELRNHYLGGLFNFGQQKDKVQIQQHHSKQNNANNVNIDELKYQTKPINEMCVVDSHHHQQSGSVSQQFVSADSIEHKGGEYIVQIQDEVEVEIEVKRVRKHRIFHQQPR